jgi:hypothetical protein
MADLRVGKILPLLDDIWPGQPLKNVVIVTHMAHEVKERNVLDARKKLLSESDMCFKQVLRRGASLVHHDGTIESAHSQILLRIIDNHPAPSATESEQAEIPSEMHRAPRSTVPRPGSLLSASSLERQHDPSISDGVQSDVVESLEEDQSDTVEGLEVERSDAVEGLEVERRYTAEGLEEGRRDAVEDLEVGRRYVAEGFEERSDAAEGLEVERRYAVEGLEVERSDAVEGLSGRGQSDAVETMGSPLESD